MSLKTPPRTAWSEKLRQLIPALYTQGELTVAEIAVKCHITEKTALRYLEVSVRERRAHDIALLHNRGVGRLEISRHVGLTPDGVSRYLRSLALGGEIDSACCPHCGR